ncbi:MAG: hypothetical protein GWN82_15450, partial [Gemmatimonadetes bacterium]|nr:hypothetical protein [Gemmatimonadota bacterium]NIW65156.1 hypothetical protein [Gemmatimonadota bacterium]
MHEEIEELDLPREPKMLEEIEDLYAYDRWANHRILEAAAR